MSNKVIKSDSKDGDLEKIFQPNESDIKNDVEETSLEEEEVKITLLLSPSY